VSSRAPRRALLVVLSLLVLWAVAPGTGPFLASVVASAGQLYRYRNSARESRALSLLGEPWRLVHEAATTTPIDARIVIPEGRDFDPLSNRTWCAFYLHPRSLHFASELPAVTPETADFVIGWRGSAAGLPGVPASTPSGVWRVARGGAPDDTAGASR
jgi:hypothetical protein